MNEWQQRVEYLKASGMSMGEIALAIDLSRTALEDIKTGRTKQPKGMSAVLLYLAAQERGFVDQQVAA